jgi:hypothetical protein
MENLIWQDLVSTALVGTQKQAVKLKCLDNELGKILSKLDTEDYEGSLLSAAGAIALYKKAGKLPKADSSKLPQSSGITDIPECNTSAEQHLEMMLNGQYTEILPEWLKIVTECKKLVSAKYLPDLLNLGQRQSNLREAILPVLGKRGLWLAAQNPEWDYVVGNTEFTWEKGSKSAKFLLVKKLRNQEPDTVIPKLEAIWKKQDGETRAILLQALETNLNLDDEAFLEAALDDKRKQVRDVASKLLRRLPQSKLVQRMIERVRPLIIFNDNSVEVTLPQTCTREMSRDGIDESNYERTFGEKASLLFQMLCCIPPSFWCENKTPQQLLQIATQNQWQKLLIEGLAIATCNHKDKIWAEAILTFNKDQEYLAELKEIIGKLLSILSKDEVNPLILKSLSYQQLFTSKHPAVLLLNYNCLPLDTKVSETVLSSIEKYIKANQKQNDWSLKATFKNLAIYLEPSVLPQAQEILTVLGEGSFWKDFVDELIAKLQFRCEMIQTLAGE